MFLVQLRFWKDLPLIQVIHNQYDKTVVKLVRRLQNLIFQHQKAALDLHF